MNDQMLLWVDRNIRAVLKSAFPAEESIAGGTIRTRWQEVVRQDSNYPGSVRGPVLGAIDLFVGIPYSETERSLQSAYAVMVRSEIASLGGLLREIRLCQTGHLNGLASGVDYLGLDSVPFLVICPDSTHAEKLKEQGVHFFRFITETQEGFPARNT